MRQNIHFFLNEPFPYNTFSMNLFVADAFAEGPFSGNPAAVCLLDRAVTDEWRQNLAMEMNLSETAFPERNGARWKLRWFTPALEVDLCGHATLATAHILFEKGLAAEDAPLEFETRSGLLRVTRRGELLEMDFPALPAQPSAAPPGLLEALGCEALHVMQNTMDILVEVRDAATLRALNPDMQGLRQLAARGIIVTAASDMPGYDFISRFFAPAAGVDEDPVTGSAHCCLAPYWGQRLGAFEMSAWQASKRGGAVYLHWAGDRVMLAGRALTVWEGRLRV